MSERLNLSALVPAIWCHSGRAKKGTLCTRGIFIAETCIIHYLYASIFQSLVVIKSFACWKIIIMTSKSSSLGLAN